MRFDVIGLVAGWSLILLTIPLTISAIIGSIMGDESTILMWSFAPPNRVLCDCRGHSSQIRLTPGFRRALA